MGSAVEGNGLIRVLLHAVAIFKAFAHEHLGPGVTLLGGLGKPHGGLLVVLLYADTTVVEESQVALGGGKILLGGLPVELRRPPFIHFHAAAQLVAEPQLTDGGGIPLFRRAGEQLRPFFGVLLRTNAPAPAHAKAVLGGDVVPIGRLDEPAEALRLVLGRAAGSAAVVLPQLIGGVQIAVLGGG